MNTKKWVTVILLVALLMCACSKQSQSTRLDIGSINLSSEADTAQILEPMSLQQVEPVQKPTKLEEASIPEHVTAMVLQEQEPKTTVPETEQAKVVPTEVQYRADITDDYRVEELLITDTPPAYKIGDWGPGGGVVFYAENGQYKECSMDLGEYSWYEALRTANQYRGGDFSDWQLPTNNEFDLLYENLYKNNVGGFQSGVRGTYWAFGQYNDAFVSIFAFQKEEPLHMITNGKNDTYQVRVVRNFIVN